jgi:single-strand DNA-binding protein
LDGTANASPTGTCTSQASPIVTENSMRGINHVVLVGRAGQDPEPRTTANGRTLCQLSLATNRPVKNGDGWDSETDWHRVVLWERNAEIASQFVQKGSSVGIEGELRVSKWTDKDGVRRSRTEVHARRLHLLGKSRNSTGASAAESDSPADGSPQRASIPF